MGVMKSLWEKGVKTLPAERNDTMTKTVSLERFNATVEQNSMTEGDLIRSRQAVQELVDGLKAIVGSSHDTKVPEEECPRCVAEDAAPALIEKYGKTNG